MVNNQLFNSDPKLKPEDKRGGDDINNWDNGSSWKAFY